MIIFFVIIDCIITLITISLLFLLLLELLLTSINQNVMFVKFISSK